MMKTQRNANLKSLPLTQAGILPTEKTDSVHYWRVHGALSKHSTLVGSAK